MRPFLALATLLVAASSLAQTGLPPQRFGIELPPDAASGYAYITPDGRTALFLGGAGAAGKVLRWTKDGGVQTIALPEGGYLADVFADGSFLVGQAGVSPSSMFRWTPGEGFVNLRERLPDNDGRGMAISRDGKQGVYMTASYSVVGTCPTRPPGRPGLRVFDSERRTATGTPEAASNCTETWRTALYAFNSQLERRLLRQEVLVSTLTGESGSSSGAWVELSGSYGGRVTYRVCRANTVAPQECETFVLSEDGQPRSVGTGVSSILSTTRDASVLTGYDYDLRLRVYRNGAWSFIDIPNLQGYEVSEDGLHETWVVASETQSNAYDGTLFQKTRGGATQTLMSVQAVPGGTPFLLGKSGDLAAMWDQEGYRLWSRGRGEEPLRTYIPSDFQLISLEGRALLALRRSSGVGPDSAYALVFGAPVRVRDANRFGQPGTPLDSVEVAVGSAPAAVTDALGEFTLPAGLDPTLSTTFTLRDLRTNRSRIVGPLRPEDLRDTTLVFPLALHRRLDQALVGLATSEVPDLPVLRNLVDAFLKYDTTNAHTTRARWESSVPLRPSEYAPLDEHLARLTMSAENLDALHQSTRGLATQTASVAVQTVTTILAAQEAVGQVRAQIDANADDVFGTSAGGILRGIVGTGLDALNSSLHGAYLAFNGSIEAALPDPWSTGWSWFGEAITKGLGGAIAGGGAEGGRLRSGGSAFLGTLIETVVEKTGGPIIDAVYIGQTQDDLNAAAHEATLRSGTGEMRDAFVASATRANEASVRIDQRVQASQALLNTAKGWADVGDVAMVVGRVPGAQIAAALGTAIRVVSGVGLVIDEVLNVNELHTAASKDSPSIQRLAFGQAAVTRPVRGDVGPTAAAATAMAQASTASQTVGEALDRYAAHLAALDAAVASAGDGIAQTDSLQRAEASLRSTLAVETARLRALASDTSAAGAAVRRVGAASGVLAGEQGRLFAGLLPYLIPSLANDPDGANDGGPLDGPMTGVSDTVRARIVAANRALDSLRVTHAAAATATASRTAPPTVAVVEAAVGMPSVLLPGEHTIRVRIANVGAAMADGVAARLVADGDTTGAAMPVLRVTSTAEQSVGVMAPGTVTEVAWTVSAADTSSSGRGSMGVYRVEVLSTTAGAVIRGGAATMTVRRATGVASEAEGRPPAAALEAVGPNPTSGRVRVRYELASPSEVVVGVYDVLGREVRRMDQGREAAGRQDVDVDVSALAVGAYAVRLVVDGRVVAAKRLVVLR